MGNLCVVKIHSKNSLIIHELNNLSRPLKSVTCSCFEPRWSTVKLRNFILISIFYVKNTYKDDILFHGTWPMNINYQYSNCHNKWWVNIRCSFKMTYVNSLLQKKLCSFTNLISQKFSDTAVILTFAVSKRCTQDLPVVNTKGSSTGFLFSYHSAFQKKRISKNSFSVE